MAQIRNRFDIKNSIIDDEVSKKKRLPNFFNTHDELGFLSGISLSILTHIVLSVLFIVFATLSSFLIPHLPKPELPKKDIEFKLVQNESKPPINKNTNIRSDRDSRAGGEHNPKKIVSEPALKASTPIKKAPQQKQVQKTPQKTVEKKPTATQTPKQQTKQATKPTVAQNAPKVQKPSPVSAPAAIKPTLKPAAPKTVSAPSAPKLATAPKSPFSVPVTPSVAPVGTTYTPKSANGASSSGSSSSSGASAPSPKFSSSTGSNASSSGSSGNRYQARGSNGSYGTGGNPSPGNPNGAPGIDARKEPNWGPYMRDLEQRIKRNWTPPKGDSSKRVIITFVIGKDGRLLSHKITKSSGVPLADRAAMSAIELTAPFRPLPPEFKGQSVPIEFTFDYNVLNSVMR